jgi:hypothetical protein
VLVDDCPHLVERPPLLDLECRQVGDLPERFPQRLREEEVERVELAVEDGFL